MLNLYLIIFIKHLLKHIVNNCTKYFLFEQKKMCKKKTIKKTFVFLHKIYIKLNVILIKKTILIKSNNNNTIFFLQISNKEKKGVIY